LTQPIMKKGQGDGLRIQLADWEGKGKTVLGIHGITANCRGFDTVAKNISPENRVLSMDLRGRGLSDKPETGYSISHHCKDMAAVLDDQGIDQAIVMGHSLGAYISLEFAVEYASRAEKLILFDGGGDLSIEQWVNVGAGIQPSVDRLGKVFPSMNDYKDLMKKAPFLNPWTDVMDTFYEYEVEEVEGGVRSRVNPEHITEERTNLAMVQIADYFAKIKCPVLVLRAPLGMVEEKHILLPDDVVERMKKNISDVQFFDVDGTNHFTIIFSEHPERDKVIREFIAS